MSQAALENGPKGPNILGRFIDFLTPTADKTRELADRRRAVLTSARGQLSEVLHNRIYGEGDGQALIEARDIASAAARAGALSLPMGMREGNLPSFLTDDGRRQEGKVTWTYKPDNPPTLNIEVMEFAPSAGEDAKAEFSFNLRHTGPKVEVWYKNRGNSKSTTPLEIKFPVSAKVPYAELRGAVRHFGQMVENLATPIEERSGVRRAQIQVESSDQADEELDGESGEGSQTKANKAHLYSEIQTLEDKLTNLLPDDGSEDIYALSATSANTFVEASRVLVVAGVDLPANQLPEKLQSLFNPDQIVKVTGSYSGASQRNATISVTDGKISTGYTIGNGRISRFVKKESRGGKSSTEATYGEDDAFPSVGILLYQASQEILASPEARLGSILDSWRPPQGEPKATHAEEAYIFLSRMWALTKELAQSGSFERKGITIRLVDNWLSIKHETPKFTHDIHLTSFGRSNEFREGSVNVQTPRTNISIEVDRANEPNPTTVMDFSRAVQTSGRALLSSLQKEPFLPTQIQEGSIEALDDTPPVIAPDMRRWFGYFPPESTVSVLAALLEGASGDVRVGTDGTSIYVTPAGMKMMDSLILRKDIGEQMELDDLTDPSRAGDEERGNLARIVAEHFPELHSGEIDQARSEHEKDKILTSSH